MIETARQERLRLGYIAKTACDYRNQTRLNSYIDINGKIIDADGYAAALERMTTRSYDALIQFTISKSMIIILIMSVNAVL